MKIISFKQSKEILLLSTNFVDKFPLNKFVSCSIIKAFRTISLLTTY